MKLTLDKLAPYLPYGLKWDFPTRRNFEYEMVMLQKNCEVTLSEWELKENDKIHCGYDEFYPENDIQERKPILRPLSDLSEKIPANEITYKEYIFGEYQVWDEIEFEQSIVDKTDNYQVFEFLFQHHFDVFGLIDKGLAIDINILEK